MLKKTIASFICITLLITTISPCAASESCLSSVPPQISVALKPLFKEVLRIAITWLISECLNGVKDRFKDELKSKIKNGKFSKENVEEYLNRASENIRDIQKQERGFLITELKQDQRELLNSMADNYDKLLNEIKKININNKKQVADRISKIIQEDILQTKRIDILESNYSDIVALRQNLERYENNIDETIKRLEEIADKNQEDISILRIRQDGIVEGIEVFKQKLNYLLLLVISSSLTVASGGMTYHQHSQLYDIVDDLKIAPNIELYNQKLSRFETAKKFRNVSRTMTIVTGCASLYFLYKYIWGAAKKNQSDSPKIVIKNLNTFALERTRQINYQFIPSITDQSLLFKLNILF